MPFYEIRLSVTGSCNQNCVYCGPFVDGKYTRGYGLISLNQIKQLVNGLKDIINENKIHIQITGGEPTLRKDLIEIFSILSREFKDIGMTTNGSMLNLKLAKKLLKNGLSDIHIHLPSLNEDVCKKTTRVIFNKNRIKNIIDSALFIKKMGGRVEFNTPITNINISTLPNLLNFCYENKLNLKLIEELRLDDSHQININSIKKLLSNWIKENKIIANETKIKKKYGIIYQFGDNFSFRIAPVDKNFKKSLIKPTSKILLDGRYWIGGYKDFFLFTPSYSLIPTKGSMSELKKEIEFIAKKYDKD